MTLADELLERARLAAQGVPTDTTLPPIPATPPDADEDPNRTAYSDILTAIRGLTERMPNSPSYPELPAPPDYDELVERMRQPLIDLGDRLSEMKPVVIPPAPAPQVVVDNSKTDEVLAAIQATLEQLAFSMKGLGRLGSGGGTVQLAPGQSIEITDGTNILGTAAHPLQVNDVGGGGGGGGTVAQGTPGAVASAWPVEVTDGTSVLGTSGHPLRTDPTGTTTQPVSAASLPLPTGAAQDGTDGTGITQPTGGAGIRGWLSGIYKALTGTIKVDGSAVTQPVSGTFWQATQPVSGSVTTTETTGLLPKVFDSITYTNTSSTVDTYKYYTGGTGGTLVATLTITWTDSTKSVLTSVVRT